MIKKILISLIFTSQVAWAQSTYNFYFNDSDSGPSTPQMTGGTPVVPQPQRPYVESVPAISTSPYAFSIMDTYLNVGVGMESYYQVNSRPSWFVKTKFLPLIGFEASLPNELGGNYASDYRAAAFLEGGFFDFLRVQLLAGGLRLNRSADKTIDPYVGVGLSLRLLKAIEISASVNTTLNGDFADSPLRSGYKFASGAVSIDIFKLFHLL